jgi:hypothetical protein
MILSLLCFVHRHVFFIIDQSLELLVRLHCINKITTVLLYVIIKTTVLLHKVVVVQ